MKMYFPYEVTVCEIQDCVKIVPVCFQSSSDLFLSLSRPMRSTPVSSMLYNRGSSSCWRPSGTALNSARLPLLAHWRWSLGQPKASLLPQTPWPCCRPPQTLPVETPARPRNPSSESFCLINSGRWWVAVDYCPAYQPGAWSCSSLVS